MIAHRVVYLVDAFCTRQHPVTPLLDSCIRWSGSCSNLSHHRGDGIDDDCNLLDRARPIEFACDVLHHPDMPIACDLLAERRICDLVDARPEAASAPPNQAVMCWQAGTQAQAIQN
jgi:hypothetical protein